ncbi:unnamed protein product [Lactuca virosa]|uniref:Uncharacterized protein n=1 Tax=Lactuca virosa TaxID=75947 RepID=A0AAU9P479_9ASTR|nr:unnamed protein product [Lactuca virosa]
MRSTSADMESILCVTPGSLERHHVDHQQFSILCVLLQMQMKYVEARLGDRVLYAGSFSSHFSYFMLLLPEEDSHYLHHQFPMSVMYYLFLFLPFHHHFSFTLIWNTFSLSFMQWEPCHAVVATPLLIAFELLLFIYLENSHVTKPPPLSLQIVFLPLLAFEVTILIDFFHLSFTTGASLAVVVDAVRKGAAA